MVREQRPYEAVKIHQHSRCEGRRPHKPVSFIPFKELVGFDPDRTTSINLQEERLQIRRIKALDKHIDQFGNTCLPLDPLDNGITHSHHPFWSIARIPVFSSAKLHKIHSMLQITPADQESS